MPGPELSIILPTCNRAPLLTRALELLQQTTHCDYEVVAVDGASDDQTAQVLAQAAQAMACAAASSARSGGKGRLKP